MKVFKKFLASIMVSSFSLAPVMVSRADFASGVGTNMHFIFRSFIDLSLSGLGSLFLCLGLNRLLSKLMI